MGCFGASGDFASSSSESECAEFTHGGDAFWAAPREYFMGDKAPARLMRLRDKLHYLAQAGVDVVIVAKFDRTFADLPAEQFIEDWLVRKLNVKFLSIGDDFKFGAKRLGNFAMLQQAGKQFGLK